MAEMSRVRRRASVRSLIGTISSTEPSALGTDVAVVPVRIALVWIFIYYGAGKLFGAFNGRGIHRTALFMSDTAHLHPGGLFAVLGGVIEFGGAIALALGVVSRLAGLALLGSGGGDGHRVVGARHQFAVGDARLRVQPGARRRRARCGPTESRRGHRTSPSIGWPACDPFGCGGVPITQLRTETTQSRRLASVKPGALVPGLPGITRGCSRHVLPTARRTVGRARGNLRRLPRPSRRSGTYRRSGMPHRRVASLQRTPSSVAVSP